MKILNWCKEHIVEIVTDVILFICIIVIIAAFIAAIKNQSNRISEGTVIDKNYTQGYTETVYRQIGNNNIPQSVYHPESYSLEIQGVKDGETVTYWFHCTAEEYERYSIGDYYKK